MTIKNQIESLALTLSPNFYYGRKSEINVSGDNAAFPAIVLIEPDNIGFNYQQEYGFLKDTATYFVQFIDILEMGNDAAFRLPIIDAMRELAAQFLKVLSASNSLSLNIGSPSYNIQGVTVIDTYDVNVAGIELQLPLILNQVRSLC